LTRDIDERKRWLALIVLCLGVLMIVLDTAVVNVALPSIPQLPSKAGCSLLYPPCFGYKKSCASRLSMA
jgi:hypothetical protein